MGNAAIRSRDDRHRVLRHAPPGLRTLGGFFFVRLSELMSQFTSLDGVSREELTDSPDPSCHKTIGGTEKFRWRPTDFEPLARYHRLMAVRVFSNNLPNPALRDALQEAVLGAIGAPSGDWLVQIHENPESPSWHVTIWGPNNFHWTREFFGTEEQNPLDGFAFIKTTISEVRKTISDVLSRAQLSVYLSYAYPDNTDGFVVRLRDRLAQELQVQTGEPVDVGCDFDRMRPGPQWDKEAEELVERATFLVPVVSPSYFRSDECRKDFEVFLERQQRTNRPLILPVYFVTTGEFESGVAYSKNEWVQTLKRHNFLDLRPHRFDLTSTRALGTIASLARSIRDYAQLPLEKAADPTIEPKRVIEAIDLVYVQSLNLTDFRCFEQIELNFHRPSSLEGRWTCIAGINGSGKSTILQALGVALLGNPLAVELGGGRLNRMRRQADVLNRKRAVIEVVLRTPEPGQLRLPLEIDEGRIVATGRMNRGVPSWDRIRQLVIAGYGATRNLSPRIDANSENLSLDVRHQISLFDPLAQLAGAEVLLGRQSASFVLWRLFQNVIRQVFGTELQVHLSSPVDGVRFTVSNEDYVEAIDLPDGYRSAIAWIADLCSIWCEKAPRLAENADPADMHAIVLIDEIDLHLHPSLQRALIPRLRRTFPRVQWIVTTHSPLVLANFDASEIIALDRDSAGNVRELDRQILGFTSDAIYEWLMGTRPMGVAIEEELRKSDEGTGRDQEEIARLMRESPTQDEAAAKKQVAEFKDILKTLNR